MSRNFVQNATLRKVLMNGYRVYARSQFWRRGPRIFINSIPKAGTHLLTAELARFPGLQNSALHLQLAQIGTYADGQREYRIDPARAARAIATVRQGQYFSAHAFWDPAWPGLLAAGDIRTVFMTRDPRDILVSLFHYAQGLRRHHLHELLTERLTNDTDRWRALVLGHEDAPYIRPLRQTLDWFLPWKEHASVLTLRFEDLVGERGGGTAEAKSAALMALADHCGLDTAGIASQAATATGATATLRKGKANAWHESLPPGIAALIRDECGEQLARFGYEP